MFIIDRPKFIPEKDYSIAIKKIVNKLASSPGIHSIYQLGSITHPGISDIDLLVIFEDDYTYTENPLSNLTKIEKYLFIHSLFGMSKSHFLESYFQKIFFYQFPIFQFGLDNLLSQCLEPYMLVSF